MPVARRGGKTALPDAWRRSRIWRTQGAAQRQLQAWPLHRRGDRRSEMAEAAHTRREGADQETPSTLRLARGSPQCPRGPLHADTRRYYQCSPSFEPSAAAVIIAGIPIATVASAIARASNMTHSPYWPSSSTSDRELRNRFDNQHLPHAYFRRISPQSFWFRGLWQKPGQRFTVCGGNRA
jgi:hypothetical protein